MTRYFDKKDYPKEWDELRKLRKKKARNRCECRGICGKIHGRKRVGRCERKHGQELPSRSRKLYKVSLQLAHRCSCRPKCGINEHLILICNGCHLRMDMDKHHGRTKRLRKLTSEQQNLFN